VRDLTDPCVPTGRKAGVVKEPWSVSTLPSLALEKLSFLMISKRKAITSNLKSEIRISKSETISKLK
jgi:hypothetical protein